METKVIEKDNKQESMNFDTPAVAETPAENLPVVPAEIKAELQEMGNGHGTFGDKTNFEHAQRVAKMLATSDLVPQQFKNNIPNVMLALEMANRIGANPLMVMQNLYVVHGKPGWSSSFIIASINASGKYSPLRFVVTGEGDAATCFAWAYDLATGEKLEGPKVSIQMAKDEGWYNKNGSKWKTMPELMLRYRSAAFFGRLYAPEIMMGMQTTEEVTDFTATTVSMEEKQAAFQAKLQKIGQ